MKKELAFLVTMFCVGALGAWGGMTWYAAKVNTPEKVIQRKVDAAIQEDLCDRIEKDIARLKQEPRTFRRTSLRGIESESKELLRVLLLSQGVPADFPIEFSGDRAAKFSGCRKELNTWLEIPSAGSQSLGDEKEQAGLGKARDRNSDTDQPAPSPVNALEGRLALVIGNFEYKNRPLVNPKYDADDVSQFLRNSSFRVIDVRNANLREMQKAVKEFSDGLKQNQVGLVYFSGHGVEHQGRNYLIPVDTTINDEDEIPRLTLDASSLVERISRSERNVNIVIIDACRSSFVPSTRRSATQGLGKMDSVRGTLIAFSTAPGMVAEDGRDRNSPYTKSLLKAMSVPGRRIEDVFKETAKQVDIETAGRQRPWYNSSLLSEFSIR